MSDHEKSRLSKRSGRREGGKGREGKGREGKGKGRRKWLCSFSFSRPRVSVINEHTLLDRSMNGLYTGN